MHVTRPGEFQAERIARLKVLRQECPWCTQDPEERQCDCNSVPEGG